MTCASRPGRSASPPGGLEAVISLDQRCAAPDQAMQFAVDGVDFLPQASRLGASMKPLVGPVRQRRYYVRLAPVKAKNAQERLRIPATSV